MEKKLEVKNLQISFRTQGGILNAVRNISFDLNKGETLAIVGESGSGKSVTSKAIIGILAGNSIVEGGEILYDGQDLLKITEDDFHKIRGDKISMIFQDPLSSLNPIMRVGQQLTEAMILNGKARQKNATREFNSHLSLLNKKSLTDINPGEWISQKVTLLCFDIKQFSIQTEYLAPKEIFEILNLILGKISPIVRENGGFIEKYLGDKIIAIFPKDGIKAFDCEIGRAHVWTPVTS